MSPAAAVDNLKTLADIADMQGRGIDKQLNADQPARIIKVTCPCSRVIGWQDAFRCRDTGVLYCKACHQAGKKKTKLTTVK